MIKQRLFHFFTFIFCYITILPLFAQQLELGLPMGHKSPITYTTFTDDSQYIISTAYDGTLLWETYTGRFVKKIDEQQYRFQDYHSSSLGTFVMTLNQKNYKIHLWDIEKGKLVKELSGKKALFSPNGKWIVTYSYYYGITQIWDTATLTKKGELKGYFVGFVDNESIMIQTSHYQVNDINTLEVKYQIETTTERQSFQLLEDSDYFVVKTGKFNVAFHQKSDGALLQRYSFSTAIEDLVFDENDTYWGVNFENDSSKIFNQKKKTSEPISFFQSDILSFSQNEKGETTSLHLNDDTVVAFRLSDQKELYQIGGFHHGVCGYQISPDHKYLCIIDCASINDYVAEIGSNNGFLLFNAQNGQYINAFFSSVDELMSCAVSPNKKYLSNITHSYSSTLFDLSNGELKQVLGTEYAFGSQFSPNGKYLSTYSDQRAIDTGSDMGAEIVNQDSQWIWDTETGKLVYIQERQYNRNYHQTAFDLVEVDYKDRKIVHLNQEDENGWMTSYMDLVGHTDTVYFKALSEDQKMVLTASKDQTIRVWDAKTGETLSTISDVILEVKHAQFLKENTQLLFVFDNEQQLLWEISKQKEILSLKWPALKEKKVEIINAHYKVVNDLDKDILNVYDASTNQLLYQLTEHKDYISSIQFIPDTHYMVSSSFDGSTIFWDLKTGLPLIKQFTFNQKYPIWLLPNGYYLATKASAQKLYYKKGLQTVGFEQLDVKYNRPDKVLAVLNQISGSVDTTMIKAYQKAWEKRIKKLEIDTSRFDTGFSIPECDIENRSSIAYEQTQGKLKLHIKALDSLYLLDRYNIWVNEVPVFGEKGVSIKKKQTNTLEKNINISLSKGMNKIEVSVFNTNGIESYRLPLKVNYTPSKLREEKLFFVGIGVDQYRQEGHDLQYSVKDIRDLTRQLKVKYGDRIVIDTLFDENVTTQNIRQLKSRLQNTSVDDKVVISFSGHGLLSEDLDYYLATYNVNFDQPQENGLPYDDLEYLLDGIPSRKKLLLIDACHSGEVDKEEVASISRIQSEKEGLKGLILVENKTTKIGLKNSFELMKELFNSIDRSTGTTVISAAAGTQFAQERGDLKNGVFTYCILHQMMEKESITVSELREAVSQQVKDITNGLQQPTSRNETLENNWKVW